MSVGIFFLLNKKHYFNFVVFKNKTKQEMKVINHLYYALLSVGFATAQVGVNTTTPSALLEIKSTNQAAPTNTDGIIIPKADTFPAANPTAAQQGMMIYLTTASGGNSAGFYFWDNPSSSWKSIATGDKNWSTIGNAGINALTNFIGTTDNVDVLFRRNNLRSGIIGSSNTGFGEGALNSFAFTTQNTGLGINALRNNIAGFNTAVGANSLASSTNASENTAVGAGALQNNNTGNRNVAVGSGALNNTNDDYNTAVGYYGLLLNTSGSNNTAVGGFALGANQLGGSNTAVGINSLKLNTVSNNTALGADSLAANTTGTQNTAVGKSALFGNQVGANNTATGFGALQSSTASFNTAFGSLSLTSTHCIYEF